MEFPPDVLKLVGESSATYGCIEMNWLLKLFRDLTTIVLSSTVLIFYAIAVGGLWFFEIFPNWILTFLIFLAAMFWGMLVYNYFSILKERKGDQQASQVVKFVIVGLCLFFGLLFILIYSVAIIDSILYQKS